jgi:hypothetical protein
MKKIFLALGTALPLLFLVVPSVLSFNCNYFTDALLKNDCLALNQTNEDMIASLIYTSILRPDYAFIDEYNSKIVVSGPPYNTTLYSKDIIKDAWVKILTISHSVLYKELLFVPGTVQVRTEYSYNIKVPDNYETGDTSADVCKITYSLDSKSDNLDILLDDLIVGNGKLVTLNVDDNSTLKAQLSITAVIRADVSTWYKYCCSTSDDGSCAGYCYDCKYERTNYITENQNIEDEVSIKKYEEQPSAKIQFIQRYFNSTKGLINKSISTSIILSVGNASFEQTEFEYYARFSEKPYYFLVLEAIDQESLKIRNMIVDKPYFFVANEQNCNLEYFNFFNNRLEACNTTYVGEEVKSFEKPKSSPNLGLLFKLAGFALAIFLLVLLFKRNVKKITPVIFALLFIIPSVRAEDCGLTNLASCIPQKIFDYFMGLVNAPLQPLLSLVRSLMENPPSIELFKGLWVIIVYCISLFYCFLIIYSGVQFMLSGHDVVKREMAKEWLKNTVLMIVLIQASFYLYGLVLEIGSSMSAGVLSLIDPHFFLLTADNLTNVGLEFFFVTFYLLILIITVLILVIRYLLVALGVLFVPIGIFCYFIPPLRSYGRMILSLLGMLIFITFLDAIVLLACSMLMNIELFQNFKILIMISAFSITNMLFIILIKHIITKSGMVDAGRSISEAVKYVAMLF